jgi:Nucleotidyl transferase AbiEii toxin, Type IV TA system
MSEQEHQIVSVDINAWVESARNDPVLYVARQCTEVVLTAIGLSDSLREILILKGGTLMALAFQSVRVTGDVDFTSTEEPQKIADALDTELNRMLPIAIRKLNYLDLLCRVQSVTRRPRPQNFSDHDFPALLIKVGYARKGSNQEAALDRRNAANVIEVEVSFKDQVFHFQELWLSDARVSVRAFSLSEVIAEKLRALLQQVTRDRYRRQDVYDIAFLCENTVLTEALKAEILCSFQQKCASRGIYPGHGSLNVEEVKARARDDWDTIKLEVPNLPEFDEQFAIVETLYQSLPWVAQ